MYTLQHRQSTWEYCVSLKWFMQEDVYGQAENTYMQQQRNAALTDQAISPQAGLCPPSLGQNLAVRKVAEIINASRSRTSTGDGTVEETAYFWLTASLAVTKRPVIISHGCLQICAELYRAYTLIASLQSAVLYETNFRLDTTLSCTGYII